MIWTSTIAMPSMAGHGFIATPGTEKLFLLVCHAFKWQSL